VALPSADEVLAKYKESLGSPDAVQKVSTLVEKGTVEMEMPPPPGASPAGPTIVHRDAEIDRELPNKVLYLIHMPTNLSREGYDGFNAWVAGGFSREETAGERDVVQTKAEFFPALRFKETHSELKVDAVEKVGSHEAFRVSGLRQDGSGYDRIYVDTQTGLLLRLSTTLSSVLGSFPVEIDYDDYRDASGLKLAFTMREANPEGARVFTWNQIEYNGKIDGSAFNVPPPRQGPPEADRAPGGPLAGGPPSQ
jgi:hypothetical protein